MSTPSLSGLTRADLALYRRPGRSRGASEILEWRYLLRLLIRKGVKARYRGAVLGWLWSYVKPAAYFTVYYLVLGVFLGLTKSVQHFPVYLFTGVVLTDFFNEGVRNGTRAIVENAPLVKKIYLPRELFSISAVFVALIHFLPQLVILIGASLLSGWRPDALGVVAAAAGLAIIGSFALGLGLFFGAINALYRDAENFVDLVLMISTWSAPVLYAWTVVQSALPAWLFHAYMLSPLAVAVELFHRGLWYGGTDHGLPTPPGLWEDAGVAALISLAMIALGGTVFRRLESKFAQEL